MTQKEYVISAMEQNGGYATLQQLNKIVDVSQWKTKTPDASIRQIVQIHSEFFKIKPGLWALEKCREEVLKKLSIEIGSKTSDDIFTHSYYQGIIVELGNMKMRNTYIPPQDKNKKFLEKSLSEIATVDKLPQFTYDNLLRRAKTVDVIWFNERNMPCGFYEVEHTTDIKNSLGKFYELQDFRADFRIVADEKRREQFNDIIQASIYSSIRDMVKFVSYDNIVQQYSKEQIVLECEI